MQTIEFMEKVKELHDRLNVIAIEQWLWFIAMVAAWQPGEDALTHGASNMDYDEQVLSLHLFHSYIDNNSNFI